MFFLFSNVIHTFVKLQIFTEITVKKLRFIYYTSLYILYVIRGVQKPPKRGVSETPQKGGHFDPHFDPPWRGGSKRGQKGVKIPPFWVPPGLPRGGATFLRQILGGFWDPPGGGPWGVQKGPFLTPLFGQKRGVFDPFFDPPGGSKNSVFGCFFGPPRGVPKRGFLTPFLGVPQNTNFQCFLEIWGRYFDPPTKQEFRQGQSRFEKNSQCCLARSVIWGWSRGSPERTYPRYKVTAKT